MTELFAGQGVKVTLHFELRLASGEVVDSTFGASPGTFEFGDETLPPGIQELIRGMCAGERKVFDVKPEQGFGMPNPNNLQRFSKRDFADADELQIGMVMSFADAAKAELAGVIKNIEGDEVEVDFNHPLAGRNLTFDVEIVELARSAVS
jgi:FKBP-type peptidyl-prolyl cis-trans isomerase SlpA